MSEYKTRNALALDEAGDYYCKHVDAMTTEQLHAKSDIAAELAYRDYVIDQLLGMVQGSYRHVPISEMLIED